MAHNYYVTALRPTAVTESAVGRFTSPDDLCLLIVRNTRLEFYLVTPEGLKPYREVPVNGRVAVVKFFRPQNESKDVLFFLTAKYDAAILQCDDSGEIVTRAHGNVQDRIGRPSETGMLVVIDPSCSMIGLRLYEGLFKIILLQRDTTELKAFNVRFEEMNIIDIAFLQDCDTPTIAFIYNDCSQTGRHIKTNRISLTEKEFEPGPWKQENLEAEASIVIPMPAPYGGVVVIGQESITYIQGEDKYLAFAPPVIKQSSVTCYCKVDNDGSRYLLGDMAGRLFMLLLICDPPKGEVKEIRVEPLGEIAIPECLTYLDNGVVFVGSRLGDSQLIRLNVEPDAATGSFVSLLDTYMNLGPIVDMTVVDIERQGQGQLVTCSGCFKEGSLRVIRNGIGIQEKASVDLSGVKGLWAFRYKSTDADATMQNMLAASFVGNTTFFKLVGEEMEVEEIPGSESEEQSFHIGNIRFGGTDALLQATAKGIRIISCTDGSLSAEWSPPKGGKLTLFTCNPGSGQLLAASGRQLYYLEVSDKIELKCNTSLDNEASCIDISPIGDSQRAEACAVGLWNEITVKLLTIPSLTVLATESLGGEILARSVLIAQFDSQLYLLVGLGDGMLLYYLLDGTTGALVERKKVTLGTQPISLRPFRSNQTCSVFACSDRPTVIYSQSNKLIFSNVNLKLVSHMTCLNSSGYPDSLALCDDSQLIIGVVDEIQKLHIRTVPLGETPRRIAYQESTQTFGVISVRLEVTGANGQPIPMRPTASVVAATISTLNPLPRGSDALVGASSIPGEVGDETEIHNLLILDQNTFEILHALKLGANEFAMSVISANLADDATEYYVVGTTLVIPDESEPKIGRLIVLNWSADGKLQVVSEKDVKGCPYALREVNGKLLAAINSSVRVFEWCPAEKELRLECSHFDYILALYLDVKGEFILSGDLMRSMSVLVYKPEESSLEQIARDYDPNWMTAVKIVDDDTFLGAENSFNLFTCQKDSAAMADDDRQRLQEVGKFHTGELVNVFKKGSLVMQHAGEAGPPVSNTILFGTVQGAIGLVGQVPEEYFKQIAELEQRVARVQPSVGYTVDDGSGMRVEATVEDVVKIVEDLSRIH